MLLSRAVYTGTASTMTNLLYMESKSTRLKTPVTASSGDSVPITVIPEIVDICRAASQYQRCCDISVFPGPSSILHVDQIMSIIDEVFMTSLEARMRLCCGVAAQSKIFHLHQTA